MTPEEQAQAWAFRLLAAVDRHQSAVFKASAPVKQPERRALEQYKPGTRRISHIPRGLGPRKTWSVS